MANVFQDMDRRIGAAIRTRRERAGLTQTELGRGIGVSFQQIQKYEKGVNRVAASTLLRMAEVLGCAVTDFLPARDAAPASDFDLTLLKAWAKLRPRQQAACLALIRQFAEP